MGSSLSLEEEPDDIIKNIHKTANALTNVYIQNIKAIDPSIPFNTEADIKYEVLKGNSQKTQSARAKLEKEYQELQAQASMKQNQQTRQQLLQEQPIRQLGKQQIRQEQPIRQLEKQQIRQQPIQQLGKQQIRQEQPIPPKQLGRQQLLQKQPIPRKQQQKRKQQSMKQIQKGGDTIPLEQQQDPLDFNEQSFNVCNRIDEFYKKQLLNLKKINLSYIAENLELKQDKASKAGICAAIIEHFQNRMNLIKKILDSLPFCSTRISNFTANGFCSNNDPTTPKDMCEKDRNEWYHVDDVVSSNKSIVDRIINMKNKYNNDLKRLLSILNKVKSDKTINSYTLDKLTIDADNIIKNMFITCDGAYRPIVKSIIDSSNAARLDALRLKEGLKPYMEPLPKY